MLRWLFRHSARLFRWVLMERHIRWMEIRTCYTPIGNSHSIPSISISISLKNFFILPSEEELDPGGNSVVPSDWHFSCVQIPMPISMQISLLKWWIKTANITWLALKCSDMRPPQRTITNWSNKTKTNALRSIEPIKQRVTMTTDGPYKENICHIYLI